MTGDFDLNQMVVPLHLWFGEHARILPWRDNPTPYRVWISEIMLQQTRVEAVKPYYERFMQELPDVKSLAKCEDDRLMKLWEGLGYYNRARNLKVAANQILDDYGGELPAQYEELLKLKGVGHYTAGAISSIAFGQPVPAVDGNVLRVLMRITADDSDIMKQSVKHQVEERLSKLMQENEEVVPQIFTQALMELGAVVCVPNGTPLCEQCPLSDICVAKRQDRIAELPVKKKAKKRRIEERTVLVIRDGHQYAIHRRADDGLLAGLYELPNYETYLSEEQIIQLVSEQGYTPLQIQPLDEAKHIFSHIEWRMRGYLVSLGDVQIDQPDNGEWIFVEAEQLKKQYAIPTAFAKYVKAIRGF